MTSSYSCNCYSTTVTQDITYRHRWLENETCQHQEEAAHHQLMRRHGDHDSGEHSVIELQQQHITSSTDASSWRRC